MTLDLVGVTEIAAMLGAHRVTVSKWKRDGLLPQPDVELPKRPLWHRANIVKWAAETGRTVVA